MDLINISFFASPGDADIPALLTGFVGKTLAPILRETLGAEEIVLSHMASTAEDPEVAECYPLQFRVSDPGAIQRWNLEVLPRIAAMTAERFGQMRVQIFPTTFKVLRTF